MPATAPYIPPKDSDLNNWANNFSSLITSSPSTYGLTSTDAGNISSVVGNWNTTYALVTSPSTKTAQTVSDKNTAKINMLSVVRPYAQQIALNPGVSSADKIGVGVNPRTSTPSPITPPDSVPNLTIQSLGILTAILRYRDSITSPSVKSKPYGVTNCQIWWQDSATPITDPTALTQLVVATKSPTQIQFDPSIGGKQVYFAARWATRKGDYSPWGGIVSATIPTS